MRKCGNIIYLPDTQLVRERLRREEKGRRRKKYKSLINAFVFIGLEAGQAAAWLISARLIRGYDTVGGEVVCAIATGAILAAVVWRFTK